MYPARQKNAMSTSSPETAISDILQHSGYPRVEVSVDEKTVQLRLHQDDITRLIASEDRPSIVERIKQLGYHYVAVDIAPLEDIP